MSRNYFSPIVSAFEASEATRQIEFQAGSNNQGVLSVEVPGRGAPGYGQAWANTITKLLSHGAAHARPANPIVGELWFDRTAHRLQMYVGVTQFNGTETNGWVFLPTANSNDQREMLDELGAINKNGDTANYLTLTSYLEVEGSGKFCGVTEFHENVTFKAAHTHTKQNGTGTKAHTGGASVTFESPVVANTTLAVNDNATFTKNLVVSGTGTVTVERPTTISGALTVTSASNITGNTTFTSKNVKSTGKILVDNTAADVSILEIGVNGELLVKGKLVITGEMISNASTRVSVGSLTPVASGTPPSITKTFTRLLSGPSNNNGKVRLPADAEVGLHLFIANDGAYDVTLERPRTTDTINGVAENMVIGAGARMQFVAWGVTSTTAEWALMNSFYG